MARTCEKCWNGFHHRCHDPACACTVKSCKSPLPRRRSPSSRRRLPATPRRVRPARRGVGRTKIPRPMVLAIRAAIRHDGLSLSEIARRAGVERWQVVYQRDLLRKRGLLA